MRITLLSLEGPWDRCHVQPGLRRVTLLRKLEIGRHGFGPAAVPAAVGQLASAAAQVSLAENAAAVAAAGVALAPEEEVALQLMRCADDLVGAAVAAVAVLRM